MKKIGIIIPYFGKWPAWMEYFLISCIKNPEIDWFFPNDCDELPFSADNLNHIPYSLSDFNRDASAVLNLEINIRHPYKICDFKPAYGLIFHELIKDYQFWGYGDLDLVYGDIRSFYTDSLLERADVFSNHPDFVAGHLCLLRNNEAILNLFRVSDGYKNAFTEEKYTGFDEQLKDRFINPDPEFLSGEKTGDRKGHIEEHRRRGRIGNRIIRGLGRSAEPQKDNLSDFSSIVRQLSSTGEIRSIYRKTFESDLMLAKRNKASWELRWDNGRLQNKKGTELLYFHFILSKYNDSFSINDFNKASTKFSISPDGIKPA